MRKIITFVLTFIVTATFSVAQDARKIQQSVDKAVGYLRTTQDASGGWITQRTTIGPTAVILSGLLEAGVSVDDPMVVKALKLLESATNDNGGVYTPDGFLQNYETCVAVMCFAKANEAFKKKHSKEPYKDLLAKADKFLRQQQHTEENNNTKPEDPNYGGIGYGELIKRPDLSNMQFFLDALKASGAKEDDPAIQKALVFVSRCQNLESEHNTMPFLTRNAENLDGGFIYYNQPEPDGTKATEGLRSYGGMTYAGLKSMIYAGLTKEDIRYKAAFGWIAKNYTVKENPGRGTAGLYYYYQTMAKTFDVLGLPQFEDSDGKRHNWRSDLSEHLISIQKENGSWVNENTQYMENDANLVTGYALLALALCLPE